MPEKLGLDQRFRQRGAVHGDQWFVPPGRKAMQTFRDQFLARAPLANDEHGPAHWRGAAGPLDCVEEGSGLAYELVYSAGRVTAQLAIILVAILAAMLLNQFIQQPVERFKAKRSKVPTRAERRRRR